MVLHDRDFALKTLQNSKAEKAYLNSSKRHRQGVKHQATGDSNFVHHSLALDTRFDDCIFPCTTVHIAINTQTKQ